MSSLGLGCTCESHTKVTVAQLRNFGPPALREWFAQAISASSSYRGYFDDRQVDIRGSMFLYASLDALTPVVGDEDVARILIKERDFLKHVSGRIRCHSFSHLFKEKSAFRRFLPFAL